MSRHATGGGMTIVEAIKKVVLVAAHLLSSRDAFEAIVAQGLYQFQAKDPQYGVLCAHERSTARQNRIFDTLRQVSNIHSATSAMARRRCYSRQLQETLFF